MAMYFTETSDIEIRDRESAKRMAPIIFAEMERLKAEKEAKEKRDRELHEAHCKWLQQFQPKVPKPDFERMLIDLTMREIDNNPGNSLCEIQERKVDNTFNSTILQKCSELY